MPLLNTFFKIFRLRNRQPSPLKVELSNLRRSYAHTSNYMVELERHFWNTGGTCCPSCGIPGFFALTLKQERRAKRIKHLEAKLERDSQSRKKKETP